MSDINTAHSFSKAVFSVNFKGIRKFRQTFLFSGEGEGELASADEQSAILLFSLKGALVKTGNEGERDREKDAL